MGDAQNFMGYRLQGQRYVTDQINAICKEQNLSLAKPPIWDGTGWISHCARSHTVALCARSAFAVLNVDDTVVVECGKRNPLGEGLISEIRRVCASLKEQADAASSGENDSGAQNPL